MYMYKVFHLNNTLHVFIIHNCLNTFKVQYVDINSYLQQIKSMEIFTLILCKYFEVQKT